MGAMGVSVFAWAMRFLSVAYINPFNTVSIAYMKEGWTPRVYMKEGWTPVYI